MKNYGLNLKKEFEEQSHEDWVFTGFFGEPKLGGYIYGIAEYMSREDIEKYLPKGELQNIGSEKNDCVSRSFHNILETYLNFAIATKEIKQKNIDWLKINGYLNNNGKVELSDRFISILSGTDPRSGGNSLKSAPETARKVGVIPKYLLPQVESLEEYYDPKCITPEVENVGKEFLKRFQINYQKVYPSHYNETVIHTGGFAWGYPNNEGVYQREDLPFNHAFMHYPVDKVFDNYIDVHDGNFIKQLSPDYALLPYSYRIVLNERETIKRNWLQVLISRLL